MPCLWITSTDEFSRTSLSFTTISRGPGTTSMEVATLSNPSADTFNWWLPRSDILGNDRCRADELSIDEDLRAWNVAVDAKTAGIRRRLDDRRRRSLVGRGDSDRRRLAPGRWFRSGLSAPRARAAYEPAAGAVATTGSSGSAAAGRMRKTAEATARAAAAREMTATR